MTAARLEELARKCDAALAPEAPDIASVLELQDIADLARCARAWAKVMSGLEETRDVTLRGVDEGMGTQWTWWPDDDSPSRAGSPLEAVEAAEVKP
jgi:hypothetical protein